MLLVFLLVLIFIQISTAVLVMGLWSSLRHPLCRAPPPPYPKYGTHTPPAPPPYPYSTYTIPKVWDPYSTSAATSSTVRTWSAVCPASTHQPIKNIELIMFILGLLDFFCIFLKLWCLKPSQRRRKYDRVKASTLTESSWDIPYNYYKWHRMKTNGGSHHA